MKLREKNLAGYVNGSPRPNNVRRKACNFPLMESSNPNSSSVRVLIRHPPSPSSSSSSSSTSPQTIPTSDPSPSSSLHPRSSSSEGVVVVGFIGRRPDTTTHLLNQIIDANVFGSGNLDKSLPIEKEELRDWFKWRRISYYHQHQKGILFLHFSSNLCPASFNGLSELSSKGSGFSSALEDHEFRDLQGMLFMFSVSFFCPPSFFFFIKLLLLFYVNGSLC